MSEVKKSRYFLLLLALIIALGVKHMLLPALEFRKLRVELKELSTQYGDIYSRLQFGIRKNQKLNDLLSGLGQDPVSVQKNLSRFFTQNSSIRFISLAEPEEIEASKFTVFLYQAVLEGEYDDLLLLLESLEKYNVGAQVNRLNIQSNDNGALRIFISLISYRYDKM